MSQGFVSDCISVDLGWRFIDFGMDQLALFGFIENQQQQRGISRNMAAASAAEEASADYFTTNSKVVRGEDLPIIYCTSTLPAGAAGEQCKSRIVPFPDSKMICTESSRGTLAAQN